MDETDDCCKMSSFHRIKIHMAEFFVCTYRGSHFRFVFLIPAESGEKITLGISTMLNMTVFLMTVMSGLPATDQTPILSKERNIPNDLNLPLFTRYVLCHSNGFDHSSSSNGGPDIKNTPPGQEGDTCATVSQNHSSVSIS